MANVINGPVKSGGAGETSRSPAQPNISLPVDPQSKLHNARVAGQIGDGGVNSVRELEDAIREFIKLHNQQPKPFRWIKSADQILASIARFATSTPATDAPAVYAGNQ